MKVVHKIENCFYGAGYQKSHATSNSETTLCGYRIHNDNGWDIDERESYVPTGRDKHLQQVDCKKCINKLFKIGIEVTK